MTAPVPAPSHHQALAAVIDRIYQLATRLDGITEITEMLARATRSRSCGVLLQNRRTFVPVGGWFWGLDQIWVLSYRDHYCQCDPTVVEHFQIPPGTAYASHYDRDNPEFRESEFFTGWCTPQRLGYFAGAYLELENDLSLRLTFQGDFDRGPYQAEALRQMEAVLPHLRRAVDINREVTQLIGHSNAFAAVLEQSRNAIVLLSPQGAKLYANTAIQTLAGQGFTLDEQGLHLRDAAAQAQFTAALSNVASAMSASQASVMQAGFHVPIPRRGQMPLSAYISPFRLAGASPYSPLPRDMVMLQIVDPELALALDAQRLREVMGLTCAEARVAVRLGRGDSAQEISEALTLSLHTVREHIKHIYARVGVNRQAEFVARAYSALQLHQSTPST